MTRFGSRRVLRVVSLVCAGVSFCRVAVLYLESVSSVRAERAADAELLDVCASGVARGSAKMRDACLRAQADRAAPIVFKAVVRAVSTAWREFADACGSPFRLFLAVLFALGVLAQPGVSWARILLGRRRRASRAYDNDGDDDDDDDDSDADGDGAGCGSHYIVLDHSAVGCATRRLGFQRRVRNALPRLLRLGSAQQTDDARVRAMESQRHLAAPGWNVVPLDGGADKSHRD